MSPPMTPRGSIFSPRERNAMPWSLRTISLASPGKRLRLEPAPAPKDAGQNSIKGMLQRSATLTARRMKRGPVQSLNISRAAEEPLGQSSGLSPIVKGLSLGSMRQRRNATVLVLGDDSSEKTVGCRTPIPAAPSSPAPKQSVPVPKQRVPSPLAVAASKPDDGPQLMPFRLQKPVPAKKNSSRQPMPFRLQKPAPTKMSKNKAPCAAAPAPEGAKAETPQPPMRFRLQKPTPSKKTQAEEPPAETQPPAARFRLQKPAPGRAGPNKAAGKAAGKVPKLNIEPPTGLISPPSTNTPRAAGKRRKPAPLSIGGAAPMSLAGGGLSPSSPCMPHTPGGNAGPMLVNLDASMFGEASPSLYDLPTPPPITGAPTFTFTPPSPAVVVATGNAGATAAPGSPLPGSLQPSSAASGTLTPCTPPWPKSGASLRRTIFDHIGASRLSPMDLRGYMAISMSD
ncbi:hypothetical protein GGF46_003492 [Coemansia sp. RSA 552]|nr:hypothetical protein GGF46_003492 [Coemansia sp. RSA 552]